MSAAEEGELRPAPPPKADPEMLVLRGRPRPVVRFRRSIIVGGIAALSATLVGLAWIALEPTTFRTVADSGEGRPFERAAPDALAHAPKDYRDVPLLGPPLPGDLGRPILEHQRESAPIAAGPAVPSTDPASQGLEARRQRWAASEQAARASPVVVQLSQSRTGPGEAPESGAPGSGQVPLPSAGDATSTKLQLGNWGRSDLNPHRLSPPTSRWVIAAGSVIPASLITGLDSDLPGMVTAEVTENVRDSATGRTVLIPQGSRLIGRYDSNVGYGQKRAFLVWQRILFPNGSSLRLDDMPASDASGYSGLTDRVDGHSWQVVKGVILSSLLGVGSQLSFGGSGIARALRQSIQQNGSQAGEQIVAKGLSVQPTIKVRSGWPVRVLVSEDLILEPWEG